MKPNLSKSQRKALIFAHDLMRGRIEGLSFLPYVRGTTLPLSNGHVWHLRRHWIEPDRDSTRPYLSEDVFTALVMNGCMESRIAQPDHVWVYRITRDGCDAIGRIFPLVSEITAHHSPDKLMMRRRHELLEREELQRRRGHVYGRHSSFYGHGGTGGKTPFNYQSRKR